MMNIVVLAAGMGKRMRSKLPKVLQPLAGRPMIEHVLDCVGTLEGVRPVVVVGHGADVLRARLEDRPELHFATQMPQLGTGHALKCALDALDMEAPRTVVCLGDVPLLKPATLKALATEGGDDDLVIVTVRLDNPKGYGRIVRQDGRVVSIVEEKDATDDERRITEVNTGIMRFPTARLEGWLSELKNENAQGEYYLTDVIGLAVRDGVRILTVSPEHLYEVEGVNSKVQLAALERTHQRAVAASLLEQGVTLADPDRIDVRGELTCGSDVFIDVGCVFEGRVHLADGVTVGPYCVIRDADVAEGTEILAYSHVDDAVVGPECRIGPFSRLRPKTRLLGGNHIGNFVEVKKSEVGEKTKINHLTYVGDSVIGRRVNVGAGVITCNYDGANKWTTTIGDDAFIGSGVKLVAPVTVGEMATIGAGGTLRKDAPANALTVIVGKQVVKEGWKRPVKAPVKKNI